MGEKDKNKPKRESSFGTQLLKWVAGIVGAVIAGILVIYLTKPSPDKQNQETNSTSVTIENQTLPDTGSEDQSRQDIKTIDRFTVFWIIQDCADTCALQGATVEFTYWKWELGAGRYFTKQCTTTSSGSAEYDFTGDDFDRTVHYNVTKPGYTQVKSDFIVKPGKRIYNCLWLIRSEVSK